ncbi:MAG: nucleotidyltransferase domain-containing protein [Chloroflexi bacterium]|nr:nucleotidyltransferase domain-containing protein [Chloroflexota bacterium]
MHPIVATRREEVARLCRELPVRRLDLFGSATSDRFNPATSDLDFVVEFTVPLSPRDYARAFDALQRGLEALFERRVDLVSAKSIINPYFAQSVAASREALYDAAA